MTLTGWRKLTAERNHLPLNKVTGIQDNVAGAVTIWIQPKGAWWWVKVLSVPADLLLDKP